MQYYSKWRIFYIELLECDDSVVSEVSEVWSEGSAGSGWGLGGLCKNHSLRLWAAGLWSWRMRHAVVTFWACRSHDLRVDRDFERISGRVACWKKSSIRGRKKGNGKVANFLVEIDQINIYVFRLRLFEGIGWTMERVISENPKVLEETPCQIGESAKPDDRGTLVVDPHRL